MEQVARSYTVKQNYCKFNKVRGQLLYHLQNQTPIKQACADIGISQPTYYKYKNILSITNKLIYISPEEQKFIDKLQSL